MQVRKINWKLIQVSRLFQPGALCHKGPIAPGVPTVPSALMPGVTEGVLVLLDLFLTFPCLI